MAKMIKEKVKHFADSLSLALYDRELEINGEKLIYYLDTNVIYPMIMGFQAELGKEFSNEAQRLVRALFSCGHLGAFNVLRPHALEINEKLRDQKNFTDYECQLLLRDHARKFLKSKGIWEIMSKLYSIAVGKNGYKEFDDTRRARLFIEFLQGCAGNTFSYIEQINGTWWQRLERYSNNRLFRMENMGPEIKELLMHKNKILHEINRILREYKPSKNESINVFQDAVSFTILYYFIREREESQSGPIVRFYTENYRLQIAIHNNSALSKFISYQKPLGENIDAPFGAELALRDTGYFIMRAWLSDLIPGSTVDSITFKRLKAISQKLNALLPSNHRDNENTPAEEIAKAIEKIEYEERKLSVLIEKFERLTIMDSIWFGGSIPDGFRNLETLTKWTEVFEFAEAKTTSQILFEEIQDARTELEEKVSSIKNWNDDFRLIMREGARVREKGRIEDPMLDLGLVRWGYSLENDEKQLMVEKVKSLLLADENETCQLTGEVAVLVEEARYNPRKCLVVCGIFWALGLYSEIILLGNVCKTMSRNQIFPPGLQLIQVAAEVKTGDVTSQRREEIVSTILELEKEIGEDQRVGVLLGIGYILYHAWKWENIDDDFGIGEEDVIMKKERTKALAQKCFALGEEAVRKIPKNEPAWAFSLNHCAYVGILTEIEPEKTEKYCQVLFKLENTLRWNFRFNDTVGTYYYLKAKRAWERANTEKRIKLDLTTLINHAERYYEKAIDGNFGDIDPGFHLNQLNIFRFNYERFKESDGQ